MTLLSSIADHIGLAVENVRLRQQAEQTAVLEDRQRLARELHDAVSQSLFSASVIAETIPRLWERNPVIAQQYLGDLHRLIPGRPGRDAHDVARTAPEVDGKCCIRGIVAQLMDGTRAAHN